MIFYQFPKKKTLECQEPLGLENGTISERQIRVSSEWDDDHATIHNKLHFQTTANKAGAWVAATTDADQWLQVDLGTKYTVAKVTRVGTQGRGGVHSQWVTKYKLQYSNDGGESFQFYREYGQTTDKVKCMYNYISY